MDHFDHRKPLPLSFIAGLMAAVAFLAFSPGRAAAQNVFTIDVFNFDFGDASTGAHVDPEINVGDTVEWHFVQGTHTVTAAAGQPVSFDSGNQNPPATFSVTFDTPGTFNYFCRIHGFDLGGGNVGGMSGHVTVVVPVPEPTMVLFSAGLASAAVVGVRRRFRARPKGAGTPEADPTPPRSGFTLVEVLVGIAILAVLTGMLLPAIHRVRESGNYLTCRNHLRQIGAAIHNYESMHGYYPGPGTLPSQTSTLAQVLPFLDVSNVGQMIAKNQPLFFPVGDYERLDPSQIEVAQTVVSLFLCPSDGQSPLFYYDYAALAGTNYVVNAGTGTGTNYDFRYPTDGVFWYGSRLRSGDMTDGLSSTIFVSEALMGTGDDVYDAAHVDPRRQWMTMSCTASPDPLFPGTIPPLTDSLCMSFAVGMYWRGDRNVSWVGGPGQRSVFNTYMMPNDTMVDCGSYGLGRYKASSGHLGGVNIILGDGSVHFIKNHIDRDTWRALSTRGDCEVLGSYCGCH
jgi:prepilin-type N-terminal cleavage/methylation domain-containing protein